LIEIYEMKISAYSQAFTANSLGAFGPAAKSAIPVLVRGSGTSNATVRALTLIALGEIHSEPELVVPALTKAVNDPDPEIRRSGCEGLYWIGVFGPPSREVRQTAPALVGLLSDGSVTVAAAKALKAIDPDAAARVGVR
jgi:HEAT repeat protein